MSTPPRRPTMPFRPDPRITAARTHVRSLKDRETELTTEIERLTDEYNQLVAESNDFELQVRATLNEYSDQLEQLGGRMETLDNERSQLIAARNGTTSSPSTTALFHPTPVTSAPPPDPTHVASSPGASTSTSTQTWNLLYILCIGLGAFIGLAIGLSTYPLWLKVTHAITTTITAAQVHHTITAPWAPFIGIFWVLLVTALFSFVGSLVGQQFRRRS